MKVRRERKTGKGNGRKEREQGEEVLGDERRGGENGRLHDPILMHIISGTLCALFFRMTDRMLRV